MSAALSISLALAALGFWLFLASSVIVCLARLFSSNAFPMFRYSSAFMLVFVPMIMVVISAIISKGV